MFVDATEARIRQLHRDGYVQFHPAGPHGAGTWTLTDLGWRTLSAAADPKPPPIKQSRTEIECELRKWAHDTARAVTWQP
jgi:hypothetical protein